MSATYEKIKIYLTAFGKIEGYQSTPSKDFIKNIINNYKSFNTANTKIILGKTFKVDQQYINSHYESFCRKIDNSNEKYLNVIIEFGANDAPNDFIFFKQITLNGKTMKSTLPIKKIAKWVKDNNFYYTIVSDDIHECGTLSYQILSYFKDKKNVISGCLCIPFEQNFNKKKQEEFFHKLIEILEGMFLKKESSDKEAFFSINENKEEF